MPQYLSFVAEIHRMPQYPWQCLNFLAQDSYVRLIRFSFLILIGRFATPDAWSVRASHPCIIR